MIVTLMAVFTVLSLLWKQKTSAKVTAWPTQNIYLQTNVSIKVVVSFVTGDLQKSQTTAGLLLYVVEQSQQNFESSSLADTATCTG